MRVSDIKNIISGLNRAQVRYLIVGGFAAIAHGSREFTSDLDLVVELEPANLLLALAVLKEIGYIPRNPVSAEDFADPVKRESWFREKGMLVFSMINPKAPRTDVDVFIKVPFDFDVEAKRAAWLQVSHELKAPVVSIDRLIIMKQEAGRPKDMIVVEQLKRAKEIRDAGK